MSVMKSNRKPRRRPIVGESYLNQLDAGASRSTIDRVRAEREAHRASRPCPACGELLVDGACGEHGTPADDGGAWLWAR